MKYFFTFFFIFSHTLFAQTSSFPYIENFDTTTVPNLPSGWTTSTAKSVSGDFTTTTSTVKSTPNALISTDSKVAQELISPVLNFSNKVVDSIEFYERRTASHNSGIVVEASLDGGASFPTVISDILQNLGNTNYNRRIYELPASLNNQPNVKIRWRIVGDGTGATGTVRFDNFTITTKVSTDLGITSLTPQSLLLRGGDSSVVNVTVKNFAFAGTYNFSIQFFDSVNSQKTFLSTENFSHTFAVGDSLITPYTYHNLVTGNHVISAMLTLTGDENDFNNFSSKNFFVGYPSNAILVNEIMYAPADTREWLEFVNNSSDTINLSQWKISDANITTKATITTQPIKIAPQQFFLLAKDTLVFSENFDTVPTQKFQISLPTLNNDVDAVLIFDPAGNIIDSVMYRSSWGGTDINGKSLERIDITAPSTQKENWGTSQHPKNATPGMVNSLSQKEYDIAIKTMSVNPKFPLINQPCTLSIIINNPGKKSVTGIVVNIFYDVNKDSIPEPNELLSTQNIATLNPGDSSLLTQTLSLSSQGINNVFVSITVTNDDYLVNNTGWIYPIIGVPPHSIIINEIMYTPSGDMPEWIEFYNASNDIIDIQNWKVSDANITTKSTITTQSFSILPKTFFVVAKDTLLKNYFNFSSPLFISNFSTLNNTTPDAVVLFDNYGQIIDSVGYTSKWGGSSGNSLERIDYAATSTDSTNWKTCLFVGTPGMVNSVSQKEFDVAIKTMSINPKFPLVNQPCTLSIIINNPGKKSLTGIAINIFYDINNDSIPQTNELLSTQNIATLNSGDSSLLTQNFSLSSQGTHNFYVSVTTANDDYLVNNTGWISSTIGIPPQSISINEIMYTPSGDMPEWIECYNASEDTIDIQNWKISDANTNTKATITTQSFLILPKTFFVIATDTTLKNYFDIPSSVFITKFSTLNNTTPDAVVLFDNRGQIIDSVGYTTKWGGSAGNSLERIDYAEISTDSTNWKTSFVIGTPGKENSIARKNFDVAITKMEYEKTSSGIVLKSTLYNPGRNAANILSVNFFYDKNNDSVATQDELIGSTAIISLGIKEQTLATFEWNTTLLGKIPIITQAIFVEDERQENNSLRGFVSKQYTLSSLMVNEIMSSPYTNMPEWIELYNQTNDTIDIQDWKIFDMVTSSGSRTSYTLTSKPFFVFPKEYVVVAEDSTIFTQYPNLTNQKIIVVNNSLSLGNSEDEIVLVDHTNFVIDSVHYFSSWHTISNTTGKSLERINPTLASNDKRNWGTSVSANGVTPALQNSIFTTIVPSSTAVSFSPNPFSPDGDGFEDFLTISYSFPSTSLRLHIQIYDMSGRNVRTLANNEYIGSSGNIVWDGLDDNKQRVRLGMYIIIIQAVDNLGGIVHQSKQVAVVATKL